MNDRNKFITIPRDPNSWLSPYPKPPATIDYAAESEKIEAAARAAELDVVYGEGLFDTDGRDPADELNWMPFWSAGGYDWDAGRWEAHFRADQIEALPLPD
jgi:hypothetical protein